MVAQPSPSAAQSADPARVGSALAESLHDARWQECSLGLLAGGYSNLTYLVRSEAGEVVLRRPPLGHVLPTAHDMAREHRVMTALARTSVPVPRTLLLASGESALGFPALVMERVVGHICRETLPPGYAETPEDRRVIGLALVDVLAELHLVDFEAVGLGSFGRPNGFMQRQLRRWGQQWDASKTREVPALDRLRAKLEASRPTCHRASIVHGDYRLDNTVLHPHRQGDIAAVLDWELSALGDPLADLGVLLAYYAEREDDDILVAARPLSQATTADGFPSRRELMQRYSTRTGLDLSDIDWYVAFSYMKIAVISQGVAYRAANGAMVGEGFEGAGSQIDAQVAAGLRALTRATTD